MTITQEITSFQLQLVSNYAGCGGYQTGFIHLYDQYKNYIGYLGIIKNEKALPENQKHIDGTFSIYFNETEIRTILETLRNKHPLMLTYNTSSKWASIETFEEQISKKEVASLVLEEKI